MARLVWRRRRSGLASRISCSSVRFTSTATQRIFRRRRNPRRKLRYARSKLAADEALLALADAGFAVTAFRLPILYGRGVGENLTRLASLMTKVPLFPVLRPVPLRSGMHIDNLAVLVEAVLLQRAGGIPASARRILSLTPSRCSQMSSAR